jgi:hypothetical protein
MLQNVNHTCVGPAYDDRGIQVLDIPYAIPEIVVPPVKADLAIDGHADVFGPELTHCGKKQAENPVSVQPAFAFPGMDVPPDLDRDVGLILNPFFEFGGSRGKEDDMDLFERLASSQDTVKVASGVLEAVRMRVLSIIVRRCVEHRKPDILQSGVLEALQVRLVEKYAVRA